MSTPVKLPDNLVADARRYAHMYSRSLPKQIEYWSRLGKMAEENPDLSYSLIKDILLSQEELRDGSVEPYHLS